MPKYFDSEKPDADTFEQRIHPLKSDRKVRPVVTPSGHRARGHFPSLKGSETHFQSLVEEDALRVFEIATTVRKVHTHPYVLQLQTGDTKAGKCFHYTPDAVVTFADTASLIEVKGDWRKLPCLGPCQRSQAGQRTSNRWRASVLCPSPSKVRKFCPGVGASQEDGPLNGAVEYKHLFGRGLKGC